MRNSRTVFGGIVEAIDHFDSKEGIIRFLHTSDLHLGRTLFGFSLEEDHQVVLDQVLDAIADHKPDALLIPGDIFDRVNPPGSAISQFNSFVQAVRERDVVLVLIAGNHDSGEFIRMAGVLADDGVLVSGVAENNIEPLMLEDEHGPVAITALPFVYENHAREVFDNPEIKSPADVMAAQVEAARKAVPKDARWVLLAHTFVAGGSTSESERGLARTVVGGIETVPSNVFDGAHYVALGHLHRPQSVGAEHVQYSGSPLAFGFDEAGAGKSMTLVDMDGTGAVMIERHPFKPKRRLRKIEGQFADILASGDVSDDFVQITVTDRDPVIDGMKQLRDTLYPFACQLLEAQQLRETAGEAAGSQNPLEADPLEIVKDFLIDVRGQDVSERELELLVETLNTMDMEAATS